MVLGWGLEAALLAVCAFAQSAGVREPCAAFVRTTRNASPPRSGGAGPTAAATSQIVLTRAEAQRIEAAIADANRKIPKLLAKGKLVSASRLFPDITVCEPELAHVRKLIDTAWERYNQMVEQADAFASAGQHASARAAYERALKTNSESQLLREKLKLVKRE